MTAFVSRIAVPALPNTSPDHLDSRPRPTSPTRARTRFWRPGLLSVLLLALAAVHADSPRKAHPTDPGRPQKINAY